MRRLNWSVTVADSDHWTTAHVKAAVASDADSFDDWAIEQVVAVMHEVGQKFIDENKDLFASDLV
jgi:hypothetical protein